MLLECLLGYIQTSSSVCYNTELAEHVLLWIQRCHCATDKALTFLRSQLMGQATWANTGMKQDTYTGQEMTALLGLEVWLGWGVCTSTVVLWEELFCRNKGTVSFCSVTAFCFIERSHQKPLRRDSHPISPNLALAECWGRLSSRNGLISQVYSEIRSHSLWLCGHGLLLANVTFVYQQTGCCQRCRRSVSVGAELLSAAELLGEDPGSGTARTCSSHCCSGPEGS